MSESTFDRTRFQSRLDTRRLGRSLITRGEVESTNDDAWDAMAGGLPDGTVVIADAQTRGRGRLGRAWYTAPGRGLAMSVVLHLGCDPNPLATLPLVVGLALSEALERLGVSTDLKWPNDLLVEGRKVAGILCEGRRAASGIDAAVVGVGVNVTQTQEDFPAELADRATSLALAGHAIAREDIAAELLNQLERRWAEHAEGDPALALHAWRARATFWGAPITVSAPAGIVRGVARDLDDDGALVVDSADGVVRVIAGDVEIDDGGIEAHGGTARASREDAGEVSRSNPRP